ncbi:MAG: methionine--tRNA ligase subunit beta, partial [Ruminococcaceae bacterium]|nr:methionine--tRNA ligase subunit beta [Oscillospiraceae bacterium]
ALPETVDKLMGSLQFSTVLAEIWKVISRANKYIDETAPWVLGKDESKKARLATVLWNLAETLRFVGILLTPFLPRTTPSIFRQLGVAEDLQCYDALEWGRLPACAALRKGDVLFPRIDVDKEIAELDALLAAQQEAAAAANKKFTPEPFAETITIDKFFESDLRVAKVVACEPVKKSKKLLRLVLDDGTGAERIVASGIAQWYKPEDLIGHCVALVANLAPAKLCGVESCGMILAADDPEGDGCKVLFLDGMTPGTKIH